jgi:3-methyladenine DNA glycosylase AlkD
MAKKTLSAARPKSTRHASTPEPNAVLEEIRLGLQRVATAERARGAQRYLKSELEFIGVTVPELRRQVKAFARNHEDQTAAELRRLVNALWESNVHELRSFAIGLLEQRTRALETRDLPWLKQLVDSADTWAHVDWLATKVIGACVAADPAAARLLPEWARHPNFWVRRSALLALHDPLLKGNGNFTLFAELATPLLGEQEFFIKKAIGWVLRATSRHTPELTVAFVQRHAHELAALSFREATRNLPPATRARLQRLRG